ncbi:Respiratory nitrate reductase alpha subunit apoprotein [Operophtera brumata]|uniref:Respiratory nitrate reductase alpha subunit apoprotein n=1 Tax=Operophtera brumata TaxID=104452 RepID=A0A0L7L2R7_OPEBR|nr:Respiratory nitrate reductase alpha subunit apoprotein [Operophtera brumata]
MELYLEYTGRFELVLPGAEPGKSLMLSHTRVAHRVAPRVDTSGQGCVAHGHGALPGVYRPVRARAARH